MKGREGGGRGWREREEGRGRMLLVMETSDIVHKVAACAWASIWHVPSADRQPRWHAKNARKRGCDGHNERHGHITGYVGMCSMYSLKCRQVKERERQRGREREREGEKEREGETERGRERQRWRERKKGERERDERGERSVQGGGVRQDKHVGFL